MAPPTGSGGRGAAPAGPRRQTERLSALTGAFLDRDLERAFMLRLFLANRRLLEGILAILVGMVTIVMATGVSTLAGLVLLPVIMALSIFQIVAMRRFSVEWLQRWWLVLVNLTLLTVVASITLVSLGAVVEKSNDLPEGVDCDASPGCLMDLASTQFFIMANIATLPVLPFIGAGTYAVIGTLEAAMFWYVIATFSPGQMSLAVMVALLVTVFYIGTYHRGKKSRLEFLLKRNLGDVKIKLERDGLLSWVRGESSPDRDAAAAKERPKWLIDAHDLERHEALGQGAWGTVFRAEWRGVAVAIKELIADRASEALETFAEEVSLLSSLRHPYVLTFLGCAVDDGSLLLITELCKGSLAEVLAQQGAGLPMQTALHFAGCAARGLYYLHQLAPPIVHQDLKPANLLVALDGTVKIADFGLAGLGKEGEAGGTLLYMAPELLRATHAATTASDVYAFGIIMWELMANGEVPFMQLIKICDSLAFVTAHIADGARPDLSLLRPGLSGDYVDLVQECWRIEIEKRPPFSTIVERLAEVVELARSDTDDLLSIGPTLTNVSLQSPFVVPEGSLFLVRCEAAHGDTLWLSFPKVMPELSMEISKAVCAIAGEGIVDVAPGAVLLAFGSAESLVAFLGRVPRFHAPVPDALGAHPLVGERGVPILTAVGYGEVGRRKNSPAVARLTQVVDYLAQDGSLTVLTDDAKAHCSAALLAAGVNTVRLDTDPAEELPELVRLRWPGDQVASTPVGRAQGGSTVLPGTLGGVVGEEPTLMINYDKLRFGTLIGSGPSGSQVFKANFRGDPVCVKVLPARSMPAKQIALLREQAVLCRVLEHPHLIKVRGVSLRAPHFCIVMDRCAHSVEALIKRGPVEPTLRSRLAQGICDGMAFLHASNVQHGGLKASNVLVRDGDQAVIADFGVSLVSAATATMTSLVSAMHSAPEVMSGKANVPKGDVWAFGILLNQMECGEMRVWGAKERTIFELVKGITSGELALVSELEIVRACCRVDPDDRPTFAELVQQV